MSQEFDLLIQSLMKRREDDLASNPFYAGGANLIKSETPMIGNSFLGAFLPGIAKGFSGGVAMGLGRAQLKQDMAEDLGGFKEYEKTRDPESEFAKENPDLVAGLELAEMAQERENEAEIKKVEALERARTSRYPSAQPLSPEEKERLILRFGDKAFNLETRGDADRLFRELNVSGEKVRPPSGDELKTITSNEVFQERIRRLKSLINEFPKDSTSLGRSARGGRFGWPIADPKSPEYRFYTELTAAQQEYARTKDSGALNVFDVKLWGPMFEGIPVYDDPDSLKKRLDDVLSMQQYAKKQQLETLRRGNVNVSNFEQPAQTVTSPPTTPASETVQIRHPRTGALITVPADDPRLNDPTVQQHIVR